ncbi:MAG: helix-turn-helix transcriptional regulator [Muribaculaceae bacterium]|nr:helix-turn-helix transcriptional regulator [Muribaculaceae bacterium]
MKHIGQELFSIIEQKRLVKKEVAERVGITPVYLSAIMRKESIDAELLERICKAIGVSPAIFFDDYKGIGNQIGDVNATAVMGVASVNISQGEIDLLKSMLEEKERTIKILMRAKGFESGQ